MPDIAQHILAPCAVVILPKQDNGAYCKLICLWRFLVYIFFGNDFQCFKVQLHPCSVSYWRKWYEMNGRRHESACCPHESA
nr:MAG TPA: hypothetical protein [Caudoviricetes sp.]